MNYHTHKLNSQNHSHIIDRQDSITGDTIKAKNEVVFCRVCQSVFLVESWEYMNQRHCNQTETLSFVPAQEKEIKAQMTDSLIFEIPPLIKKKSKLISIVWKSIAVLYFIFFLFTGYLLLANKVKIENILPLLGKTVLFGIIIFITIIHNYKKNRSI